MAASSCSRSAVLRERRRWQPSGARGADCLGGADCRPGRRGYGLDMARSVLAQRSATARRTLHRAGSSQSLLLRTFRKSLRRSLSRDRCEACRPIPSIVTWLASTDWGCTSATCRALSEARTRSISPENFSGEPGQGGMATEGTGAARGARPRPGLEGLAVGPDRPWPDVRPGGRSTARAPFRASGSPAETSAATSSCGSTGTTRPSRRSSARSATSSPPAGAIRPGQLAGRGGQSEQRPELLLGDAVPQAARGSRSRTAAPRLCVCYYQINYTLTDVPEDAAYFHAQFRRTNPLPYKSVYTMLDGVQGQGHYVGTYLAVGRQQHRLVGRRRDQVLPRRRRRVPDHLRHRHRGLLRRRLRLGRRRSVRHLHHAVSRACTR